MECNPELEKAEAELQERLRRERQESQHAMPLSRKLTNILFIWLVCFAVVGLLCLNWMRAGPDSGVGFLFVPGFILSSFILALVMTALVALF